MLKKMKPGKVLAMKKSLLFQTHKSRVYAKKVQIKKDGKRNITYHIYQKQMIYYSKKYADRQKNLREVAIQKAKDLIKNPGKYTQATSYGCTKIYQQYSF